MGSFLLNIMLTLVWVILTEDFSASNFIAGFLLSFFLVALSQRAYLLQAKDAPPRPLRKHRHTPSNYASKPFQIIGFILFFIWELFLSNLRVAWETITPAHHMEPGVVAIPLDIKTDHEITLLANLITLTPGTLSLDVSDDKKTLYIHAMYIGDDKEAFIKDIKDGFERRVMEVFA